ncbi:MAG: HAD family hydrolase [Nanoarchaeota archaeon]|nr:HAD family hydrolase [Nanoarchaeota archaeon]
MMKKAVLFDYDDTLENFAPAEAVADVFIAEQIQKHYDIAPRDFLKEYNNVKVNRIHKGSQSEEYSRILWITEVLSELGKRPEYGVVDSIVEGYWRVIAKEAKLFPNTITVLNKLGKKYKLAMISDSDGHKRIKDERLKKIGITKYFDLIVTSDDTGYDKPDKRVFLYTCDKLGVHPKECIMVGDSPKRDLMTPKRLGMTTVWTTECLRRDAPQKWVDYEISEIGELWGIIELITKK